MSEFFDLMFKPFLACLILTGIHAYLGLHVIKRGVIFVDLALAQVAALGATLGFLWGWSIHSSQSYFLSLGCTIAGAAILALTRFKKPVVPHESLIGIVYVMSAAAAIMVLSRSPEGGEELKSLLVGHLLFVDWHEIIKILTIYSVVGIIHWLARKPFIESSSEEGGVAVTGRNVRMWDFLFYGTFGLVVTSSTELAGVLLVFSFLIVPAVCGAFLSQTIGGRLAVGWIVGALTSVVGITASYYLDFPTGATIVCAFSLPLMVCAVLYKLKAVS